MDVNFIKERGVFICPIVSYIYDRSKYIGYRHDYGSKFLHYDWKCVYDGVIFIGGLFGMVEITTGSYAVSFQEIKGKPTYANCMKVFEDKLKRSGKTIHEVVRDYKLKNLDLETWLVNLVII